MEIVITVIIICVAIFIVYKSINKSSKAGCNCNSCSSHCPKYEDKNKK